jgi:hypothetical protein
MKGKERALKFVVCSIALLTLASPAFAGNTVEFHIRSGTGKSAWNTHDAMLVVKVGDTVHIVNDDVVNHRLHTFAVPCAHGPEMAPSESYDCVIGSAFDPDSDDGPVYDHDFGPSAPFWLKAIDP